jgi:tight adherence protein C
MNTALKDSFGAFGTLAQPPLGRSAGNYLKKLDELLTSAGEPWDLKGVELFGMQLVSLLVLPLFFEVVLRQLSWFSFLFEGPKQFLVLIGLMVLGFMFPVLNIRERARKRQRTIALQLPDTLDLLTISVEAGLDFMSAMRRVVEKHRPGPLKDELDRFFRRTELGLPRRDALRSMARRVQLPDLNAVVSALIQGDRLGVSIGPILRAQSDMLRTRRGQRAEKAAQEAPVKMLAPLMICILPAVFIMIPGPVIIQIMIDAQRQ